ncbi:TetR family transcriptional regulator [Chryseobacterium sp. T16E-39]|nr:TetR family transcriptional regulator [Chryseobacterium sp. T16E-39]
MYLCIVMARNKEFILEEKLEKAKNVFWKKGYASTSMQDLVENIGLNPGSIYGTFGNKHELFLDSLKVYCNELLIEYKMAADSAPDSPLASLKAIIKKAIDYSFTSNKACMVVKTSFELAPDDEKALAIIKHQTDGLTGMMTDIIKAAQEAGEINPDKNPEITADFIISSFAGFWHLQNLYNNKERIIQLSEFLIESIQ